MILAPKAAIGEDGWWRTGTPEQVAQVPVQNVPKTPSILSNEAAAEMIELYLMALLRDIPFNQYERDSRVLSACENLSSLIDFMGPKINGQVTPQTIFRGDTSGDCIGPYLSQFFTYPISQGLTCIDQKYKYPNNANYMTSVENYLNIQNRALLEISDIQNGKTLESSVAKYLSSLSHGCAYIHNDDSFEYGMNAYRILRSIGCPRTNNLEMIDLFDLLGRASKLAGEAVQKVKWSQLKIRPEEYGFLIHQVKNGKNRYDITSATYEESSIG